jgi:hypothetical protein
VVEEYWKWLSLLSKPENPAFDNDGGIDMVANNSNPLKDKYIFLSFALTGSSQRRCTIPRGKKVLIPSLSCIVSSPSLSNEQLMKLADVDHDNIEYRRIIIDGKSLRGDLEKKYRVRTNLFTVTYPQNAIHNSPAGSYQGIADGAYIIWEPTPGRHIVHFEGKIDVPTAEESIEPRDYIEDVTYTLIVE